jgi:serine/threonine-protein kinase
LQLQEGTQLGPYKIISLLGSGGMGTVYLATDTRLDRKVAVKVLTSDTEKNQDLLARFEKEAKAIAALSHANILAIYDVGIHQDVAYIVTEYLEGETLRDRLRRSPLSWRKAVELATMIADALATAHSKGIIHRDLKPENIFLTTEDHAKILDFGLARLTAPAQSSDLSALQTQAQTQEGIVLGTMPYMSPEQARGEKLDARTDIYSFGCVLQEMITGQRVFSRTSSAETIAAILKEEAPRVSASVAVPQELDALIARCLEKDPERRFQSTRDLAFELKQILAAPASSASYAFTEKTSMQTGKSFPRWILVALFTLLAIAAAIFFYFRQFDASNSIAVLPFVNESGDAEAEYFSDGITESLINNLSRLSQLKVIARTSAFRYKGKQTDPLRAGKELGVQNVLTGRVLQRGEMLIVQADLLDVKSGSQLWGEKFNRKLTDIFLIQEGISREISDALRLKLTRQQEQNLQKRQTASVDAYQLYLKGRYHWNKRFPPSVQKGLEFFQQAIEKDPAYADAYVGLAESYVVLSQYSKPLELMQQAEYAAKKALAIDPDLGEAHATLAFVKGYRDWDWAGAEQEFQKAIRLNPNYATTYHWYGLNLTALGRFEEAKLQFARAREIDPLSLMIHTASSGAYSYSGDYDQAKAIIEHVLEMDPNFMPAQNALSNIYFWTGDQAKSIETRVRIFQARGDLELAQEMKRAYEQRGYEAAMRKVIEIWEKKPPPHVQPWLRAILYSAVKDKETALHWLQKGLESRNTEMIFINVNPTFDFLHGDPRFQKMLAEMNIPAR